MDGVLKKTLLPSGETMSIEFYTTKVSAHNTYIVADLKDGSSVKTDTRTFYVTKKGVCVITDTFDITVRHENIITTTNTMDTNFFIFPIFISSIL